VRYRTERASTGQYAPFHAASELMRGANHFWWRALKRRACAAGQRLRRRLAAGVLEAPVPSRPLALPAPEPGSALAPDGGAWVSANILSPVNGARPRTRLAHSIYLPPAARRSSLPLVVMLHGCEQSAADFAQGTRMNRLAAQAGFVVLYPQQSGNAHRHRCWHWYDQATQDGSGDTALIAAMIETVVAKYAIDRSRIYAAGMSAGASMAHILALRHPDLIAAVGLHSGVAFGAADSALAALKVMHFGATGSPEAAVRDAVRDPATFPALPAILIHGARDGVVNRVNLDHLSAQFRTLNGATPRIAEPVAPGLATLPAGPGGSADPVQCDYYVGSQLMLRVCEVPDLAHAWSGGDDSFPFHASGGPDASALMWAFFKSHRRLAAVRARAGATALPAWNARQTS
jgi:poly(hydroxyalkanoate) depolymerase family esterase